VNGRETVQPSKTVHNKYGRKQKGRNPPNEKERERSIVIMMNDKNMKKIIMCPLSKMMITKKKERDGIIHC